MYIKSSIEIKINGTPVGAINGLVECLTCEPCHHPTNYLLSII